ncbi:MULTISPECIES: hypothetical protein [Geobacillus]|uniref:hypothetical protein n=1 Tax=Geobacillus TaxID=129337 RepID=UPI000B0231DF|nr:MULTISPECIES: hypothetical protein [Geobacillus]
MGVNRCAVRSGSPLRFAMTTLNDWSALGIGRRKNGGTAPTGLWFTVFSRFV